MRNNFEHCLEMLLEHEGGYVNHPDDPGGMTNLGVTKTVYENYLRRKVSEQEMRALKPEDVAPLYKQKYWDRVRGDDLPSGVDWAVFDWAVNSGPGRAAKALQRAAGATIDGVIGAGTLRAVADHEPTEIVQRIYYARKNFYENLSTFPIFGKGWTRRNEETLEQALRMAAGT